MTFTDIIKDSFTRSLETFPMIDAMIALICAFLVGLFIYFIYRKTFSGVMFSKPFSISLVMLTLITTFIISAVTSNVVLSLGMVGALSIVRFRTAIKDPLDLVFLFWSIGAGIITGAGLVPLAVVGSLIIGGALVILTATLNAEKPYILMLDLEDASAEDTVNAILQNQYKNVKVKSKTISNGIIEIIYEIRIKDSATSFMNEISSTSGVTNTSLVSYNGEYAA